MTRFSCLPDLDELEPCLPRLEHLRDRRRRRARGVEPRGCLEAREIQQVAIAQEVDRSERRDAGLGGAEEAARAPQEQIALGDLEAISGVGDRPQTLASLVGERRLVQQAAVRLPLVAPDAPAQL